MGGINSGRGIRRKAWRSKKPTIGSMPGLVVPELIKLHNANPNSIFSFQNIRLNVDQSSIHLESMGDEKLFVRLIKVAASPCNYGNFRYFGLCPACQRQVRTLYLHKKLFACRHCFRMVYRSQNATLADRLYVRVKAIGKKINNDAWTKPKWMRQKTFTRLRKQYFDLDEKEQIASFFSLRNNQAVNKIFTEYGSALIAAEAWGVEHFGINAM